MKKLALFLVSILTVPGVAFAGNSSSHVNVNNHVSSSSENSSSVHTDIRIETNGVVKTYSSDKPEEINIESEDGTSKVHVDTREGSQTTTGPTTTPEVTNSIKIHTESDNKTSDKSDFEHVDAQITLKEKIADFVKKELKVFEKLFSIFH